MNQTNPPPVTTLQTILVSTATIANAHDADVESTSTTFFRVVFTSTLFLELILSVSGGWFVCNVITKHNLVWRTVWIYLFALAASDVGVASTAIPLMLITTFYEDILSIRLFCNLSGAFLVFFGTMSIMTVAMISIHKYITMASPLQALRRKIYRDVVAYLLLSLTSSVFLSLAPVVGLGQYAYKAGHKTCVIHSSDSKNNFAYYSVVMAISFVIPILIVLGTTLAICRIEKGRRRMIMDAFFSTPLSTKTSVADDEDKVVNTMTLIIASSLLMWGPLYVHMVLDYSGVHTPLWYYHLAYLCMLLHGAINPVIYFRHKTFRDEFRECRRRFQAFICRQEVPKSVEEEN